MYGFTQREREALRRKKRVSNEGFLILIILLLVVILGFEFQVFIARAETNPVVHQNDYYCHLIADGEGVIGADSKEIESVCDKYN